MWIKLITAKTKKKQKGKKKGGGNLTTEADYLTKWKKTLWTHLLWITLEENI